MDDAGEQQALLMTRPTLGPKINLAKNLICLFVALMAISVAAIFIVTRFYSNRIESSIAEVSLLKDTSFSLWGSEPNIDKNVYRHRVQAYTYNGDAKETDLDPSKFSLVDSASEFDYSFEYAGSTFSSGNVGEISFRNQWRLKQRDSLPTSPTKNINLGLNKVFYQFNTLPIQRKFPVLFNTVLESMKQQFLRQFFTQYLFKFFFHDTDLVKETVFKPLGLGDALQTQLLTDSDFGWNSTKGLQSWMTVCLLKQYDTAAYSELRNKFGLTGQQMQGLVGSRSTMYHLTLALNGTIKSKLAVGPATMSYQCAEDVCNNDELMGSQWSVSFLTKSEIFPGVNLNMTARDLNSTYQKDVQFSEFCTSNNLLNNLTIANALPLLSNPDLNLKRIDTINYIVANKNSPDIIDQYLDTPGSGIAIIQYINQYFYQQLILNGLTNQQFTWAWMVYSNFQQLFNRYRWFLLNQYLSRAIQKAFTGLTCRDYFSGDVLGQYADTACSTPKFNITNGRDSYFEYVQAYFFQGRQTFKTELKMEQTDIEYLFGSKDSLFASQMSTILGDLSVFYKCETQYCTDKQLAYRQWGDNSILAKLPQKYFDGDSATLLQWDTNNLFKGVPSEYALQTGQSLNYGEVKTLLSNDDDGVMGLLSLLKRIRTKRNSPVIGYLNRVLLGQTYNGLLVQVPISDYILGYEDPLMKQQNAKPPINGGTPWESSTVSLIQLNNTKELSMLSSYEQSKMNTGIFSQAKLRTWKAVNGYYATGYKLIIDQDSDGNQLTTWIDTGRSLNGTNLLGYHPQLDKKQKIQVYIQAIRRTFQLEFDSQVKGTNRNIFKYTFVDQGKTLFVGDETLDGRYFRLNAGSYISVEALTGQTVEMQISITYLVKTGALILQDSETLIPLFDQQISFTRGVLTRYDGPTSDNKKIKDFTIGLIVSASVCLSIVFVLAFFLWRWRKSLIHLDDAMDDRVIRTSSQQKDSQITQGSIY